MSPPAAMPCAPANPPPAKRMRAAATAASAASAATAAAAPSPKRMRVTPAPSVPALRADIAAAAHVLRLRGIAPVSLFFASLPPDLRAEPALRALLGPAAGHLKTVVARGRAMAWATYAAEPPCLHALLTLRLQRPDVPVSLHRPKPEAAPRATAFAKQLHAVRARGGVGNTLLFRNLPVEVDVPEFEHAVQERTRGAVRTRSALSKGGTARSFWVVYGGVEACETAFRALRGSGVSFRCGRAVKLHPIVHDDSTDADEKKRRERAASLGMHKSRGGGAVATVREDGPLDLLERYLRASQNKFVFLSQR